MIKTFRGLIEDGGQDTLSLHTNKGLVGYRILKFEVFPNLPGTQTCEATLKIYKVLQTNITNIVDFSNSVLLAASYYMDNLQSYYTGFTTTIFDGEIFNQDIYITSVDTDSTAAMNYYIELEQFVLNPDEATVATLKDIRNAATV